MRKILILGLVVAGVTAVVALMAAAFLAGRHMAGRMFSGRSSISFAQSASPELLQLRIEDADGQPVPTAQVRLKKKEDEYWNSSWAGVTNGRGTVTARDLHLFSGAATNGAYDVVARAPGFAPAFGEVTLPSDEPLSLVMQRGRTMRLRITTADGRALPQTLRPMVVLHGYERLWRSVFPSFVKGAASRQTMSSTDSLALAEPEGDGWFRVNLPTHPDTFDLLVDEPGFLRAAWSGPYTTEDGGAIEVELPEPAVFRANVTADREAISATEAQALSLDIVRYEIIEERQRTGSQIGSLWIEPAGDGVYEERLAPGNYSVRGMTSGRSRNEQRRLARFTGGGEFEAVAGETVQRNLHFELVPPQTAKGDGRAVLTIRDPDGKPSAGRSWRVTYSDREISEFPVASGTLPPDGRIVLENLRDNENTETYRVAVDDEAAGTFFFRGTNRLVESTLQRAPGVGDRAPAIPLTRMTDGAEVDTASFAGQVIYYDFWATWCGPCQRPMAELHALAQRRGEEWKGRVVLAAVSIDDDLPTLADHVAKQKWDAPLHLWAGRGVRWKSEAAQAFSIHGVPTGVLVDRDGRIVWRGHPGSSDAGIEKRIEDLLR